MSNPNIPPINPLELFGMFGNLANMANQKNEEDNGGFELGALLGNFGGLFGDEQQGKPAPQKQSAPSATKVAADVANAAGTIGSYVKSKLPKRDGVPAREVLIELLMDMLQEHDGLGPAFESKRESLYRATATKWADKILKQEKPASRPEPTVTEVPVTEPEPEEPADETPVEQGTPVTPAAEEANPVEAVTAVAKLIHAQDHPDHPIWEECSEGNIVCRYQTLAKAVLMLNRGSEG